MLVYTSLFFALRRSTSFFVSVRADVLFLLLLGGGGTALGAILFISHDWVRTQTSPELVWTELFSAAHCSALGTTRCALHFAGGVAVLAVASLLLITAAFEVVYKSTRHEGSPAWAESLLTLSSDLGSLDMKRAKSNVKKRKSKRNKILSISDPFPTVEMRPKNSSEGALPLITTPSPCSTYPALPTTPYNGHGMELDTDMDNFGDEFSYYGTAPPRPAPNPPSQLLHSGSMGSMGSLFPLPNSTSTGSVSTLATTPLFGLAPAVSAPKRTTSMSPSSSYSQGLNHSASIASSKGLYHSASQSQSQSHTKGLTHSASLASSTTMYHSTSPSQIKGLTYSSSHGSHEALRPPHSAHVNESGRPKLSMEQIERKRLLLSQGTL